MFLDLETGYASTTFTIIDGMVARECVAEFCCAACCHVCGCCGWPWWWSFEPRSLLFHPWHTRYVFIYIFCSCRNVSDSFLRVYVAAHDRVDVDLILEDDDGGIVASAYNDIGYEEGANPCPGLHVVGTSLIVFFLYCFPFVRNRVRFVFSLSLPPPFPPFLQVLLTSSPPAPMSCRSSTRAISRMCTFARRLPWSLRSRWLTMTPAITARSAVLDPTWMVCQG